MSSRLGGAMAPLIIGALMAWTGSWRRAFWVLGGVGAAWALFFAWWFRDRPEDFSGANEAEQRYIRAGAGSAGSIYEESHSANVPWLRMLTSLNLAALCVAAAAVSFSWFFYVTFLPKYLEERFHVDFAKSEVMSGLPLLVGGISCLLGGRLSDWIIRATGSRRWGRSSLGLIGFTAAGLCALAIPYAQSAEQVVALICTACAFQDLAVPCLWSTSVDIGGRFAGTVSGAMNSASAIGGALSPLIVAMLVGAYDWNVVFRVFAVVYSIGGMVWLFIDASRPLFEPTNSSDVEA
jgi:sugar phosphate permease